MLRNLLLALPLLAAAPAPVCQDVEASDVTAIYCGKLLDRPGQPPRERATLLIANGVVVGIADGHQAPRGARTIDLREHFVLPGLIDCHTHISSEYTRDVRLRRVEESDADATVKAVVFARHTLEAGFTTIRNVGSSGDAVFAVRDAIAEGLVPGPRILAAGESISPSGGHSDGTHGYRDDLFGLPGAALGIADGVAECRKAVRLQVKRGADVIKLTATGGVLSATNAGTDQQFYPDELEAIVDTAHLLGRRAAAHAHGTLGIKAALRAGVDSIEHGSYLDAEAIELFTATGAYLVPTLLAGATVMEYAEEQGYFPVAVRAKAMAVGPVIQDALRRAHEGGVRIAFGTDSGVSRHGDNWKEFPLMVAAGMSPMDCLHAATVNAADLCGLGSELGTLEVGKRADVIALVADPLADVAALADVAFVMRDGVVHKRP